MVCSSKEGSGSHACWWSQFPHVPGPVVLLLDTATEEHLTVKEVLENRSMFSHSEQQDCGEWQPLRTGLSAWGAISESAKLEGEPDFDEHTLSEFTLHGVASMRNMSLIYPCKANHWKIHCPCSICWDLRSNRRQHFGKLGLILSICHQACNRAIWLAPFASKPSISISSGGNTRCSLIRGENWVVINVGLHSRLQRDRNSVMLLKITLKGQMYGQVVKTKQVVKIKQQGILRYRLSKASWKRLLYVQYQWGRKLFP